MLMSDNAVNASNNANYIGSSAWDVTPPTVVNTYSCDTDLDGYIDRMQVNFSEDIVDHQVDPDNFEIDNDDTNDETGELVPTSYNTATNGCDGRANDTDSNDDKISLDLTDGTEISGTEAAYLHNVTAKLRDRAGNRLLTGSGLGTENDMASPVLMNTSPVDGGSMNRTSNITLTFSEAMDTTFDEGTEFDISPDPTDFVTSFDGVTDTTVTINPNSTFLCGTTYTFTTGYLEIHAAQGNVALRQMSSTNPVARTFTFTATGCGSSGGGSTTSSSPTYSVDLTTFDDEAGPFTAGDAHKIEWTSGGTRVADFVNLLFSSNGGNSYSTIVKNTANTGSYSWTIPSVITDQGKIRIETSN